MGTNNRFFKVTLTACFVCGGCSSEATSETTSAESFAINPVTLNGECANVLLGNRYLDAYVAIDGNVVTRPEQGNDTQLWCFTIIEGLGGTASVDAGTGATGFGGSAGNPPLPPPYFTIRHRSFSGQFLDAYTSAAQDFGAVLRDQQFDHSQYWELEPAGLGSLSMKQRSTGRFLSAHADPSLDFRAMTRTSAVAWTFVVPP